MSKLKPLLAIKADYEKIRYPVLATPKLDGIRCLMVDGEAKSRSLKHIPNQFVQDELFGYGFLDGELMVEGDFNAVSSAIMSHDGEPDFTYWVFDTFDQPDETYANRVAELKAVIAPDTDPRIKILEPIQINNEEELEAYLEQCINDGFEGIMLRDPKGRYKFGRSTVKDGILLKVKRFHDDEAILVDVIEKMHNNNDAELDELGHTKRSSCKENLVPAGTAGALVLNWKGIQFNVGFGVGWTDEKKQALWDNRHNEEGKLVTFRYQELSKDGVPRFGKLVGFRHEDDL